MASLVMVIQLFFTIVIGLYFWNALKTQQNSRSLITGDNKKEMEKLKKMREVKLTKPLSELSRPNDFSEIIGQEDGIKALKAALCGSNPQHVIIYGPPGVGKTAAARLVLEYTKFQNDSPFGRNAKFVEIDATTLRFDDRGIADPLIGSVHDPIYQGAGALGVAGVPQPRPGAVTKAHGGILFLDEIGELHPIELNKLLKVLEDRKVFLDSAYYNSDDSNIPTYIKDIFENGLPADFRLIGATTRRPEEISPAIRSRCVEIFFTALNSSEICEIAEKAVLKIGRNITKDACKLIGMYCSNAREAINLVQLATGVALQDKRYELNAEDIKWVLDVGRYIPRYEKSIRENPLVGYVNGVAVIDGDNGTILEIEASAVIRKFGKGSVKITGIIEEETIEVNNKKIRRKSTALCSVQNVLTVLKNRLNIDCDKYDIHINFAESVPVDGPSAGTAILCSVYSAIMKLEVSNVLAMTGEVSLQGYVKPVGGVPIKIKAAKQAGVKKIIIPSENWQDSFSNISDIEIVTVSNIDQLIDEVFLRKSLTDNSSDNNEDEVSVIASKGETA
ncbi:ATP-dependent protease LonB [Clostridium oryzae]|uniref:endopeptidase La n=1 Tax=Clostridium oryzae TaxID=1450648 RepID=A0A1V4ILE2_9CLOT|nr:ATP-dependent protease LonB [Clostridium oryzae]OPJ60297.1 Lon protease 2 [Clostridium oryzae]